MVPVGSHKLHILCKGSRRSDSVIEQGAGEPSRLWWRLQDQVAEFSTVCTDGRSEPAPTGRTIEERADELHTLLSNASIPSPYVLVAHSYGGLIVRSFAQKYPGQTGGLVFVDTPEQGCIFRQEVLDF